MQHILIVFYALFFATGFMGVTALALLKLRLPSSRLLGPLLIFQSLFLVGMGLIVVYFYMAGLPGGISGTTVVVLRIVLALLNSAVWVTGGVLVHRMVSPRKRRRFRPTVMEVLASLVILWTLTNAALIVVFGHDATGGTAQVANERFGAAQVWALVGHVVVALALAKFGLTARGPLNPNEPEAIRTLVRRYGLWALVFAPAGLIEFAVEIARLPWLPTLSLDQFLYLSLNLVSMSAAIRLLKPDEGGTPMMEAVPDERRRMLNLSAREAEIAVLIARGMANKQIAADLSISPATVRTHIYNLYQKVGAGSRVELLNKLRG
ncbi:MAG: helix-turn-helix transcriptional regulator [Spirochaeta sp.]|nr:helix-turn-helix transcriptional regulator [Spirochaeta sp.]